MAKKFDGVIEAVRYTRNGKIGLVRAYERRGATFSDRVLLDRQDLLERIGDGKVFFTGRRKPLWASTFEIGRQVRAIQKNGEVLLTTRENPPERDELEETPAF